MQEVGRGSLNQVEIRPGETTGPLEIVVRGGDRDPGAEGLANLAVTLGERAGAAGIEVVVVDVAAGSEAERAGVHVGDLVRAVDGVEVQDMSDARRALGGPEGSDVIVDIDSAIPDADPSGLPDDPLVSEPPVLSSPTL